MAVRLKKVAVGWDGNTVYRLDADKLESGDKVAVVYTHNHGYSTSVTVLTVDRLTATQVVCKDDSGGEIRYRRETGMAVSANSRAVLHAVYDPAVLDAMEAVRMLVFQRKLESAQKGAMPTHEARSQRLAFVTKLAADTQRDLDEIHAASVEWEKAVADVA